MGYASPVKVVPPTLHARREMPYSRIHTFLKDKDRQYIKDMLLFSSCYSCRQGGGLSWLLLSFSWSILSSLFSHCFRSLSPVSKSYCHLLLSSTTHTLSTSLLTQSFYRILGLSHLRFPPLYPFLLSSCFPKHARSLFVSLLVPSFPIKLYM